MQRRISKSSCFVNCIIQRQVLLPTLMHEASDLQGIKTVEFGDGYSAVKTMSKSQKETLKLFHIPEPVSQYKKDIAVPNMIKYARKPH